MKLMVSMKKKRGDTVLVKIEVAKRIDGYYPGEVLLKAKCLGRYAANNLIDTFVKGYQDVTVEYATHAVF